MQSTHLEVKRAPNKIGAILDIQRRNEMGWALWSKARRKNASDIRTALQDVYSAKIYEPNPRELFIAIKVAGDSPRVKDRKGLQKLETQLEDSGVTKVTTNQGIIYRIPR